jgi:hypothetical protein
MIVSMCIREIQDMGKIPEEDPGVDLFDANDQTKRPTSASC